MFQFSNVTVEFFSEKDFDYFLGIVFFKGYVNGGRRFFRYFNMWKLVLEFSEKVRVSWNESVRGILMYWLVVKLKRLKMVLKGINRGGSDIEKIDNRCFLRVQQCQEAVRNNMGDTVIADEELEVLGEYKFVHKVYVSFL